MKEREGKGCPWASGSEIMEGKLGRDKGRGDRHYGGDRSPESRHGCSGGSFNEGCKED